MSRTLVLLVAHAVTPELLELYGRLVDGAGEDDEVRILFDDHGDPVPEEISRLPHHTFRWATMDSYGYTEGVRVWVPGLSCLPVIHLGRDLEGFRDIWYLEWDVRFHGDWSEFFDAFRDDESDFVSGLIYDRTPEMASWPHWKITHPTERLEDGDYVRSFNPVSRYSMRACRRLDEMMRDGWRGHHEAMFPTLLRREGLTICDFGGTGPYVSKRLRNRFYVSRPWGDPMESYRFRPPFPPSLGPAVGKIYHPVKAPEAPRLGDLAKDTLTPEVILWCRENLELGWRVLQLGGGFATRELVKCFFVSVVEDDVSRLNLSCARYFHAPLVGGFYQREVLEQVLQDQEYEAIVVGGPPTSGAGRDDARVELKRFLGRFRGTPIVVVDDVHQPWNRLLLSLLAIRLQRPIQEFETSRGRAGALLRS